MSPVTYVKIGVPSNHLKELSRWNIKPLHPAEATWLNGPQDPPRAKLQGRRAEAQERRGSRDGAWKSEKFDGRTSATS